jgi:hypothetical protein
MLSLFLEYRDFVLHPEKLGPAIDRAVHPVAPDLEMREAYLALANIL